MSHSTKDNLPGPRRKGLISPNGKNNKSQKIGDVFPIWADASPQLSIRQALVGIQKVNDVRQILTIRKVAPN
jgi:hypothetical protein